MSQVMGQCVVPADEESALLEYPADITTPVGVLVDPQLVGDVPHHENKTCNFYPCKVQEKNFSGNCAKFSPECPLLTTYQEEYVYGGRDRRLCRTYEYKTNSGENKCEIFLCRRPLKTPPPNYGRKRTDLKPTIKEAPDLGRVDFFDPKNRVSEYMSSVSKLGQEIINFNLYQKAAQKEEKARRGVKDGGTMSSPNLMPTSH